MILLAHMLFGAAIGALVKNIPLAIAVALLSHYFLDLFPHVEYLKSTEESIKKIKGKHWKNYLPDMLKTLLDLALGVFAIFLFSSNHAVILYICAIVAIIPDGMTVVTLLFPNKILQIHHQMHTQKIHYLTKRKKFPLFWRISTQVIAIAISIMILQ